MQYYIIEPNGTIPVNSTDQTQTETALKNHLVNEDWANMKKALQDFEIRKAKATGNYKFNDHPVLHASSGKIGAKSSVSLFGYVNGGNTYLIAMGGHENSTSYKITYYYQDTGDFKKNAKISL